METRVKRMPYSTKDRIHVRAFSRNQVYIWKYQKPSGKPKKPKQPKRSRQQLSTTIEKTKITKKKKMFRPMSAKVDMGLKVLFFLLFLVFPMVFDSFCLDLFGCFGFFGFPYGFWYSPLGSRANPLGDGSELGASSPQSSIWSCTASGIHFF